METNESILTREVVAIDDRKKLGKMKDLCVDCDARAVNYYILYSAATNSPLVLPFENSVAVGDTFMTIQSRDDVLPTSSEDAKKAINEGFRLIGVEVFSKAGNRLGTVEGYEFDPTYGNVTKIILGKRSSFDAETFIFFSPEFVFVDDGVSTAKDLRSGSKGKRKTGAKMISKPARGSRKAAAKTDNKPNQADDEQGAVPVQDVSEEPGMQNAGETIDRVIEATAADNREETVNDEDAVLKEFLVGAVVNDDVVSKDGGFEVKKGTILTEELVAEAQAHDALLLLTMSVEA